VTATQRLTCPAAGVVLAVAVAVGVAVGVVGGSVDVDGAGSAGVVGSGSAGVVGSGSVGAAAVAVGEVAEAVGVAPVGPVAGWLVRVGVALLDVSRVLDGFAVPEDLAVLDGLAVPADLAVVADGFVLLVGLAVAEPDVAVAGGCVGDADVLPPLALREVVGDPPPDGGRSGVGEALRDEDEPGDDGLDVEVVGLEAVGLDGVGVGVGVVAVAVAGEDVAVAEGLGDSEGSSSASHDCLLAGGAAAVAAAARLTPETAVSRRLPATRATAAGLGCANRMKRLPLLLATARNGSLDYRQSYPVGSDVHSSAQRSRPLWLRSRGCLGEVRGINVRTVRLQPLCVACRVLSCNASGAERETSGASDGQGPEARVSRSSPGIAARARQARTCGWCAGGSQRQRLLYVT
jgi:hypothetical protein